MKNLSFKGHRFPADIIRNAVWLYFRFTLSLRDVEELMAQTRAYVAGSPIVPAVYPHQIAFNLLPHIDTFEPDGYSREEIIALLTNEPMTKWSKVAKRILARGTLLAKSTQVA